MDKNEFINVVTNNGERTEMVANPYAEGENTVFNKLEKREVEGTPFIACLDSDGRFVSAQALLRRGNGLQFNTTDLNDAAGKLFDAIESENGLAVHFLKVYKSQSSSGNIRTNYKFTSKEIG